MTTETAAPAPAPAQPVAAADRVAGAHLWLSLLFLVAGLLGALYAALQLVWPQTLGGVAFLSYGRLTPAVTHLLVFGWLAIGLFGVGHHVVGRTLGMPAWGGPVPLASVLLVAGGLVAGVAAVLAGGMEGRELGELPLWADVIVAAGLLGSAYSATRTADPATRRVAPPAVWYALAGMWFTALAFVVANAPGLMGVNLEIQSAFALGALLFGGLPALGIAAAYHYVAGLPAPEPEEELAEEDGDPDQLARIGFWTLLFIAGWMGPALLVHGPAPGWLQTVGVAFAILYLLPVLTIVTDLLRRVQGRWSAAAGQTGIRLLAVGVALLPLLALAAMAQSLRASASVVGFTTWREGVLALAIFGLLGAFHLGHVHLTSGAAGRPASWHFGLTVTGAAVVVASLWAAGLHAGYTWVATSNSGELADAGLGFRNAVEPLAAWFEWRAAGLAILLVAALLLGPAVLRARRSAVLDPAPVTPPPVPTDGDAEGAAAPRPLVVAVQGALGLFVVAVLALVVVPSLEQANRDPSLRGEARVFPAGSAEARGQAIYVQEGCVYCHTQQVRPVIADVGLGPVSQPGDYAELSEPLLGYRRLGPDLMHAGAREPTDSSQWISGHLADPYLDRPWSIMPSYDYLSAEDLQALAQYIAALD